MSPLSTLGGKKLSLQYCLKLSCNSTTLHTPLFSIVNSTLYLKKNPTQLPPLAIRVSGDLQAVGFKKSDVITLPAVAGKVKVR